MPIETFDTPADELCPKDSNGIKQNIETFDEKPTSNTYICKYDNILIQLSRDEHFNFSKNNELLKLLKNSYGDLGQKIATYLNMHRKLYYGFEYPINYQDKYQVEQYAKWFCDCNPLLNMCIKYSELKKNILKLERFLPEEANDLFIKKIFLEVITIFKRFEKFFKNPHDFSYPFNGNQLDLELHFSNCRFEESDTAYSGGNIFLEFCNNDNNKLLKTRIIMAFLSQIFDSKTNENFKRAVANNLLTGKCTKEQLEINSNYLSLNNLNSTLLTNFAAFTRERKSKREIEQLFLSSDAQLVAIFEENKSMYGNFLNNLEDSCKKNPEGLDYPREPVVPTTTEAPAIPPFTKEHSVIPTPKNTILASKELTTATLAHDISFLRGYLNGKTADQISAIVDSNQKSLLEIVLDNGCDIQTVLLLLTHGAYKNLDDFVSTKKLTLREFALSNCKNHNQIKNILELYPLEKNGVTSAIELNAFNPDLHNNPPEILNPVFQKVRTPVKPEALVIEAIIGALQGASHFSLENISKKLQEKYPAYKKTIHNIVYYLARLLISSSINLLRMPILGSVTFLPKPQSSIAITGAYFAENLVGGIAILLIIEIGQRALDRLTDNESYKKWIKLIFNYLFNLHCIAMIFTSEEFQNNPLQVSLGYGTYFAASLLTHTLLSQCIQNGQNQSSRSGRFCFFKSNHNTEAENVSEERYPLQRLSP